MDRIAVSDLSTGRKLKNPMYNRSGRLLLADDQALTRSMKASLESGGVSHVYLGEWDPLAVARIESNCMDYRMLGAGLLQRLEQDIESELEQITLEVNPDGVPLSGKMNANYKRARSRAEVAQAERDYEAAVADTRLVLGGGMEDAQLPAAAERVALKVLKHVKTDLELLFSITRGKSHGGYFEQHSLNTVALSMSIAAAMGFSEEQVMQLGIGALFMDIGMRNAPVELLSAKRRLTASEHVDIQKHTIAGLNAMQKVRGLPGFTRFMVYQHHERVDGKGYPKGRKKARIHAFSRIVSVADAYDSLVSPRPWRPALHPYRAMETLLRGSESAYDNAALRGLLHYQSLFPIGSLMTMSGGDTVKVIGTNPGHYHHPVVIVLRAQAGSGLETHQIIDLHEDRDKKLAAPFEGELFPEGGEADADQAYGGLHLNEVLMNPATA